MRLSGQHDTFLQRHAFVLSDDPARLDMDWVLDELAKQYWSKDEPRERLRRSLEPVYAYGVYAPDGAPAGFVSVLSDLIYNARISNLFVIPEYQGRGLGRWIMSTLLFESQFASVRNWQLQTDDRQAFYTHFGFRLAENDGKFMTMKK